MTVPFVDLTAQYEALKGPIDAAIADVIRDTAFIRGPYVARFEEAYAEAYGVKHCIGVANGTDAIYILLKVMGIGPGDEVITVANSWISTSETISQTGATPVFVDIEEDTFHMDVDAVESRITPRTKAVIPVHFYGQPMRIDALMALCERHGLPVIEDCAQAHFATYNGQKVGTFGVAGTFSFYPGKNLGAYGDAGAIVTDDDDLARRARMYANHGALVKHEHEMEGINSRLDGMQAAILSAKLPHAQDWNAQRAAHAARYTELLQDVPGITPPPVRPEATHIFHVYAIRSDRRDALRAHLEAHGIQTAIHYPTILPLMPAYAYLGHTPDDFPVAAAYQQQILSLPMYPELTEAHIQRVVEVIKAFAEDA